MLHCNSVILELPKFAYGEKLSKLTMEFEYQLNLPLFSTINKSDICLKKLNSYN